MLAHRDAAASSASDFGIEHPNLMIGLVADVEFSRSRVDRHARQKHFRSFRGRFYRAVERRFAVSIVEDMNLTRVAARDKELSCHQH